MSRREVVNIRLDTETIEEIDRLAETEARSRSDMIRLLILEGLEVRREVDAIRHEEIVRQVRETVSQELREWLDKYGLDTIVLSHQNKPSAIPEADYQPPPLRGFIANYNRAEGPRS